MYDVFVVSSEAPMAATVLQEIAAKVLEAWTSSERGAQSASSPPGATSVVFTLEVTM